MISLRNIAGLAVLLGLLAVAWWHRDVWLWVLSDPLASRANEIRPLRQQAAASADRANTLFSQKRYEQARSAYEEAARLYERALDAYNQAAMAENLGHVEYNLKRPEQAAAHYRRALAAYDGLHEQERRMQVHTSLADVFLSLRRYDEARVHYRAGREIAEQSGDRGKLVRHVLRQGAVERDAEQWGAANAYYTEALALAQSGGDLASMGEALAGLARAAQAQGRAQESLLQYEMALAAFEGAQDTRGQAAVLIALGRAHTGAARYDLAQAKLQRAVKLCAKLDDADRYAEALELLGIAEAADGDLDAARRTLTDAGLAYRHAGAAQNAERVATRLQELERGSSLGEQ